MDCTPIDYTPIFDRMFRISVDDAKAALAAKQEDPMGFLIAEMGVDAVVVDDVEYCLYAVEMVDPSKPFFHKADQAFYRVIQGQGRIHFGRIKEDASVEWKDNELNADDESRTEFIVDPFDVHWIEKLGDEPMILIVASTKWQRVDHSVHDPYGDRYRLPRELL